MCNLKYFMPSEFEKCVPKCDISQMNPDFLQRLDAARSLSGIVFKLNSAFRSSEYDKSKGRTGKGFHTLGRAVDVACTDSASRLKIIAACFHCGLTCGISKRFIHIDDRDPANPIAFLY